MIYSFSRNEKESFPRLCFTSFAFGPSYFCLGQKICHFFLCLINLSYDITQFNGVNQWMHVAPNILIFHVSPRDSEEPQR